ncbi:MAG: RNA methyltransferase [Flavobacterium sp.]|nr:RNA methyltransferase [Flavobacterium sp.]
MVTKNQIKLITSLQQKKFRQINQLFIAEGVKVIDELLKSNYELEYLYVTESIFENIGSSIKFTINYDALNKISALATANNCLAVFKIPEQKPITTSGITVALDTINDPGNFGTIIRLCDWYGINQIVCSPQTVDLYNPKVIQATMGSISRVNIAYLNLHTFLKQSTLPVYGTFMDGENVYKQKLPHNAILLLGNEANGISDELLDTISNKIAIPRFGELQKTESLNVATATAIFLSEFKREF